MTFMDDMRPTDIPPSELAETADQILAVEIGGLEALRTALGSAMAEPFAMAVDRLMGARGRVVVSGMGKSGHVARKIAATFASTGAPALFVHPAEASHGDLGMIAADDIVIALSKSGETAELGDLLGHTARFSIPLIAIAGKAGSTLDRAADISLILPRAAEACTETQAPTTSTTMMMALGDALAVSLMRARGVTASTFQGLHPGGMLGAALRRVADLMHNVGATALPLTDENNPVRVAIDTLQTGGFGVVGLTATQGALTGVLTDGDLRRLLVRDDLSFLDGPARAVMTRKPRTVSPDTLAGEALGLMGEGKITSLFVVTDGKPVGLLHIHDLLASGIV